MPAATALADDGPRRPPLRDDLKLFRGPRRPDGAPTWTLYDPARNRFFRFGWLEFELLSRWNRPGDPVAAVGRETALRPDAADLEALSHFLADQQLVAATGTGGPARFAAQAERARPRLGRWLLHNYLFFRVPLVRPDRFLTATAPWLGFVGSRTFRAVLLVAALLAVYLVSRQWAAFTHGLAGFLTLEGALWAAVALAGVKVAQELGHAWTAKRHGLRVPTMGVAFLLLWPVLYTDTTDAWKLERRRPRLEIGAAGMLTELAIAVAATLAWTILPDGPARSAALLLASVTWLLTLAINLNPFMRFDGYYLLSDLLDIENLQERSFALARWRLRRWLFGFADAPPEPLPAGTRRLLVAYAVATWIYRLFLFLAIALLVYHFAFKLLGIVLMAVELGWFVARPVCREVAVWWRRHADVRLNANTGLALLLAGGAVALLAMPWRSEVVLPAVLEAERTAAVHAPAPAQVAEVLVAAGDVVAAGTPLIRLQSPDSEHGVRIADRRIAILQWQLDREVASVDLAEQAQVTERRLAETQAELAGFEADLARLTLTAPIGGRVSDLATGLRPGLWVDPGRRLALLVSPDGARLDAYVAEHDLARLAVGATGRFVADEPEQPDVEVRVEAIDRTATAVLPRPYLASVHGGGIVARQDPDGALLPETSIYRVSLRPLHVLPPGPRVLRGTVRVAAGRISPFDRIWRAVAAVLVRESGF